MNLKLMSMEELGKLAKDTTQPIALRREALHVLDSREKWLYHRHLYVGSVSKNYVSDL